MMATWILGPGVTSVFGWQMTLGGPFWFVFCLLLLLFPYDGLFYDFLSLR
ncbi:MAG: hypothetical protein MH208_10735 [Marinobacter sp.]|nr:hypothetical protein [Marinobacter sp.]